MEEKKVRGDPNPGFRRGGAPGPPGKTFSPRVPRRIYTPSRCPEAGRFFFRDPPIARASGPSHFRWQIRQIPASDNQRFEGHVAPVSAIKEERKNTAARRGG